ncbi:GPO family capsid scaffolding protein [Serratia marcescens]|uniref:GPO family capsid scaffolding protein n=1 Tax=Serratia marcescens TaxID=615 RepID=UPI0024C4B5E6|nr:GPO family capsid scaffolding protein [Serratia marcescens]MDK1707041.1 GPO family capsid scaffolding protein [Serratia marcescens]
MTRYSKFINVATEGAAIKQPPFWIMLAREGETTDGRHISAETLIALAESYSPGFYCAPIRKSHFHRLPADSLGEIIDATTELNDDAACLYVLIQPNEKWFSVLTEPEQETVPIYPAMEYMECMAVIDAPYIKGMALTTEPAIKNLEPLNKYMVKA